MNIETELLYKGSKFAIYAIVKSGVCLATDFIENECTRSEQKKVVALLQRAAEHGPPKNKEKYESLRGGISQFKSYQIRIPCFFDKGGKIILTHGFRKKKTRSKTFRDELEKAKKYRDEYLG